jgi:hypothetical protein
MRDKMDPTGNFAISNIRLLDGDRNPCGTADDRVLEIERGMGTVAAVYDSLRAEGHAFFFAKYDCKEV